MGQRASSRPGEGESHQNRKKQYIQQHGSPPRRRQHLHHHSQSARSSLSKPPAAHFNLGQRLSQTLYTYKAHELKKEVIRAAHLLADSLLERGIWRSCTGLGVSKKVLKKELKKRVAQRVEELLNEREALSHELREYNDLHGLIRKWTEGLLALNDRSQPKGVEQLIRVMDHIYRGAFFDLKRAKEGRSNRMVLDIDLVRASAQFANSPWHDSILVFLDLMVQGVPEMKKTAVLPLLEVCLEHIDAELKSEDDPLCYLDLSSLDRLQILGQEGYIKGLLGTLLDLQQHRSFAQLANSLKMMARSRVVAMDKQGGLGPHLFSVLFQLIRGMGRVDRLSLRGGRWLPAESIVDFVQRHPELEELDLSYCRQLTSPHMDRISKVLLRVRELNLRGLDRIEGAVIEDLVMANFSLHTLDISECDQVTMDDLMGILQVLEEREGEYVLYLAHLIQLSPEDVESVTRSILGEHAVTLRT